MIDLEQLIRDISVVINKASYAKKDAQRSLYYNSDDFEGSDDKRIELLSEGLSDASYDIDSIKDSLYEIVEALENEKYRQELEALSPFKE